MAGAKKKKKPAANPARGFATTSIASKPRPETSDPEPPPNINKANGLEAAPSDGQDSAQISSTDQQVPKEKTLSPEEFERQLEESELQILVDKYSQKAKRDAQRQRTRLETDRRLLRGSAESINFSRWIPQELLDQVLDLIKAETRFAASGISSENGGTGRMPSEEDLIIRLWTLRQTLEAAAFPDSRVDAALDHILDIAPNVANAGKDSLWGLEEAFDWLAQECSADELSPYEAKVKPINKDSTPSDSPFSSRAHTPKPQNQKGRKGKDSRKTNTRQTKSKNQMAEEDMYIEPEDLIPEYLSAKSRLLLLGRVQGGRKAATDGVGDESDADAEMGQLEAKLDRIENDVLFDKAAAEQQWKIQRVILDKQMAAARQEARNKAREASRESRDESNSSDQASELKAPVEDEVAAQAEAMAAQVLAEAEDDDCLGDVAELFASLPQNEVNAETGISQTVVKSGSANSTLVLRDFGEWSGMNPRRLLEEACRSRDTGVKIYYKVVSETPFASRQSVDIWWTKPQEAPLAVRESDVETLADQTRFMFTMVKLAASGVKQAEAYISTCALFFIFGGNAREEKISLRLPPVWKEVWTAMADARKEEMDSRDRDAVRCLRGLVRQRHDQELEDGVILQSAFKGRGAARGLESSENGGHDRRKQTTEHAHEMQRIWTGKLTSPRFQKMLESRKQLPMWQFKSQVLAAVDTHQVVIICGETGCGKSTQVPAFLLEHELSNGRPCKIYCTEPRRISAVSLARRVSEELGESKGDVGTNRSLVGYSIRLEANTSRETRLVYATTGIVMRMLEGSNDLGDMTHLVLDEVHERSIDSDFLLIVLKRLLTQRKDLKVLLMSATVDAERFSAYLDGAPILNVPGRTFPVQVRYLEDAVEMTGYTPSDAPGDKVVELDDEAGDDEATGPKSDLSHSLSRYSAQTRSTLAQLDEYRIDFDLVVHLMAHIATDASLEAYSKAVLIFLPGIAEIRTLNDMLLGDMRFAKDWLVYPLHSTIATEDQEAAFLVPPAGMRKVVLATNIAETGITIPDVTCVIDTGKHREMRYDEKRQLSRLIDTFISRANAKQRRGRAGRVQNGLCFHMFTKYRHDKLMADQQTPEMLRLSLQDLAMRVKICKLGGIDKTLGDALDPPSAKNIRRAIDALIDVRALTAGEDLTPLGRQLARLPLDVFLGKLILLGTVFKCLDMALTVAAILSSKSPFSAPFGQRAQANAAKLAFRRGDSDVLTVYNAYLAWKRVCRSTSGKEYAFCRKNYLSPQTLAGIEDVKGQLLVSLADSASLSLTDEERRALRRGSGGGGGGGGGRRHHPVFFEVPQRVNVNSDNDVVASAVVAWSFYPKLLVRDGPTRGLRNVGNNQTVSLHPSSVNRGQGQLKWLSYYHIMQSKSVYHAHETTAVEPFAIALLCGDVRWDMFSGVVVLDGNRARFALPDWKSMLAFKVLRARLRDVVARAFRSPGRLPSAQLQKWLDVWQRVFVAQHEMRVAAAAAQGGGGGGGGA